MLQDIIANTMLDTEAIVDEYGNPLVTWKASEPKKPKVNTKRMIAEHETLAEQYMELPPPVRTMRRTKLLTELAEVES